MPLDLKRLWNSDTWAMADGWAAKALINLWARAWHQVPAGSLPDDERLLAKYADVPDWQAVREVALRGFRRCSDGRLYHGRLCEIVVEKLARSRKLSEGGKKGAKSRWGNKKRLNGRATHGAQSRATNENQGLEKQGSNDLFGNDNPVNGQEMAGKGRENKDSTPSSGTKYEFEGLVIRLTQKDFASWEKAFHRLDLRAELVALDAWYDANLRGPDRKKWFHRASAALRKKHNETPREGDGIRGDQNPEFEARIRRIQAGLPPGDQD